MARSTLLPAFFSDFLTDVTPVSYTHLLLMADNNIMHPAPVSYTHLDVYKRQVISKVKSSLEVGIIQR